MRNKRVLVAMSGGVDSSVAAYLLLKQGYEVMGSSMRIGRQEGECCRGEGIEDARRVAQRLGIPFYVLNLKDEFEKEVINYFCREYSEGRTPNPCIICNQKVKFGGLLRRARELGADYLASGHYARIAYHRGKGRYVLKKAKDVDKDQSYVLFSLSQKQLASLIFPLGDFTKKEVRNLAKDLNLPVHDKPESQEICFIPKNDYNEFLRERIKKFIKSGPILDRQDGIIGEHAGLPFFTIGQRRGLGIARGYPLYVIALDRDRNALIVGKEEEAHQRELIVSNLNWISIKEPTQPLKCQVKVRYRHREAEALLLPLKDKVRIRFEQAQRAITPGQAAVFYDKEKVLGGGWIEKGV